MDPSIMTIQQQLLLWVGLTALLFAAFISLVAAVWLLWEGIVKRIASGRKIDWRISHWL